VDKLRIVTMASTLGIVLTAAYMLWTLQRVFLGKANEKWGAMPDVDGREIFMLVPLAIIVLVLGIYPSFMLNVMTSSVNHLIDVVAKGGVAVIIAP
jgi:NADH-quinone oxidoreductase subunit M